MSQNEWNIVISGVLRNMHTKFTQILFSSNNILSELDYADAATSSQHLLSFLVDAFHLLDDCLKPWQLRSSRASLHCLLTSAKSPVGEYRRARDRDDPVEATITTWVVASVARKYGTRRPRNIGCCSPQSDWGDGVDWRTRTQWGLDAVHRDTHIERLLNSNLVKSSDGDSPHVMTRSHFKSGQYVVHSP